jgi:hypothetical protein
VMRLFMAQMGLPRTSCVDYINNAAHELLNTNNSRDARFIHVNMHACMGYIYTTSTKRSLINVVA